MKDLVKFIVENADKFKYDENNRIINLEECFIDNDIFENCNGIAFSRDKKYRLTPEPEYVPFDYTDDLLGMKIVSKNLEFRTTISSQSKKGIYFQNDDNSYPYDALLRAFTQFEGIDKPNDKPCGKLKGDSNV